MNTTQLECFVTVAENLNFARAASILHITQPAVTHQIVSLEGELDAKLFIRTTRSVKLTPEGWSFLADAKNILNMTYGCLLYTSVVTVRQTADEAVRVGQPCGRNTLLVRGVQAAVADIVHDRSGEQVGVLKHHSQGTPQVRLADLVDVDAVVADFPVLDVVKAVDQVGDRGLTRAGGAHKGDLLARGEMCIRDRHKTIPPWRSSSRYRRLRPAKGWEGAITQETGTFASSRKVPGSFFTCSA